MSKMTNKLLSMGVLATGLMLTASVAHAQNYQVTTDTQAYTPFTNTGDANTPGTFLGQADDGTFLVTLNFDFVYFGQTKAAGSSIRVSSNGFASFDTSTTASSLSNNPIPSTSAPDDAIFLFHDDLNSGTFSGSGRMDTLEQGTAPNRTLTIQFTGVQRFGSANAGNEFNAQIVLFEGTNVIRLNYDQNAVNFTGGSNISGTIGIENATGDAGFGGPNSGSTNTNVPTENYIFTPFNPQGVELLPAGDPFPSTTNPLPGSTNFTMTRPISNVGTADSGSFDITYYLSTDSTIDTNDVVLGTETVTAGLLAGTSELQTSSPNLTIPANQAAGPYFIGFIMDPTNAVVEADDTNNASTGIPVQVGDLAELVATSVTATPQSITAGGMVTYTRVIDNTSTAPVGAFRVEVFLSTDSTINRADTRIEDFTFTAGLGAGATDTSTLTVQVPVTLAAGNYFVGVFVDFDNLILENDDTNNSVATTTADITVAAAPQIDLQPTVNTPALMSVVAGSVINVDRTIVNNGTDPSGSFTSEVYLSTDNVFDAGDLSINTETVASIAAGGSDTATLMVTIPSNTNPGNFFLIVRADSAVAITEIDETNNELSSANSIAVAAAGQSPDLTVPTASLSTQSAPAASDIMVTRTIMNSGTASGAFRSAIFISTDNVITTSDIRLTNFNITNIAASASDGPTSITVTIPNLTPGTYFIGVIADDDNQILELDEFNNTSAALSIVINNRVGDLDGDGLVNIMDIQACINQSIGLLANTPAGDVNGDGNVNVLDVQLTINTSLQPTP